ncbi:MAG: hypothetical protein KUG76_00430 [Gammaproteobacteria bacterium]|nr:hypothetical protein [Gammaproteobacteria bacterium]
MVRLWHKYLKRSSNRYFSIHITNRSLWVAFEGGIAVVVKALFTNSGTGREIINIMRNTEQILLYDATGVYLIQWW